MLFRSIWAKIGDADVPMAVEAPHGYGAERFGADGAAAPKPDPQRDGEWRVVGWVTSGGYGHHVGLSLAQGYIPKELISGDTEFQVEVLGQRRGARLLAEPPFDPDGSRMRG